MSPTKNPLRPTRKMSGIVGNQRNSGGSVSLRFLCSSDVGPSRGNISRPTRQVTESNQREQRGALLSGFCGSIASLWEVSRDPADKCPRSGGFPSLCFVCFRCPPLENIERTDPATKCPERKWGGSLFCVVGVVLTGARLEKNQQGSAAAIDSVGRRCSVGVWSTSHTSTTHIVAAYASSLVFVFIICRDSRTTRRTTNMYRRG